MAISETKLRRIQAGDYEYEISAKFIQAGTLNKSWEDIEALVTTSFTLVVLNQLPAANAESYASYSHSIVLVPDGQAQSGNVYSENVIIRSGTEGSYTYAWEQIGTTEADLSQYVKKGTYTTDAAGAGDTGSAGAETITTSSAGEQTASGTATITYDKAATVTGEAGAINTNTGLAGGATVNGSNFSFNGDEATISVSIDYTPSGTISFNGVGTHSHTASQTISVDNQTDVVTGVTKAELTGDKTFATEGIASVDLKSGEGFGSQFNTDAIKSASLTGDTTFATEGIKSASIDTTTTATLGYAEYVESIGDASLSNNTGLLTTVTAETTATAVTGITTTDVNVFASASVDANGVLSFGTTAVLDSASASGTATAITGLTGTTKDVTLTNGTKTTKYIGIATQAAGSGTVGITTSAASKASVGLTTTAASLGTVGITGGVASGTTAVLKSLPTIEISEVTATSMTATFAGASITLTGSTVYTPAGTIGGSQTIAAHSHTVEAAAHTHSIGSVATEVTGTAAVAVSSHTHSVTTSSHTHSIGNHTHNITLNTPNE